MPNSIEMLHNITDTKQHQKWDDYVNKHPNSSIYHLSSWAELITNLFGHKTYFLYSHEDMKINGLLPLIQIKSLLFGNFLTSVPYFNYGGVISDNIETETKLLKHAANLANEIGINHIEYRDTQPRDGMPSKADKITMLLPLAESHDDQWSAFTSKLRAQIRRPTKEGIEIRSGSHEQLDDFYSVFAHNMRDLGTPVYPKQFFKEILDRFKKYCHIIVIRHQNQPVAAGFLIGFKHQLEIPWASSLREYNRISPNMALYWECLKYAIDQGYKSFDFGRCSKGSGTYRFKKQWGAQEKPFYWHYWLKNGGTLPELNPNNPKYQLAIRAWQKLPIPIANFLGPKIVKNIP